MEALITASSLDFRAALPAGGALLGIDLGTQTIGTAFCDAGWRFASPGKTLKRGKFTADKAQLAALMKERSVKGIVIGLPLNMDGSEGPRSQSSRAYARNLASLGAPILLWDERWSTVGAERVRRTDPLGRFHHGGELLFVGIKGGNRRTQNAHEDKQRDDQAAGERLDMKARHSCRDDSALFSSGFEGQ